MGRDWGRDLLANGVAQIYANRDYNMVYCRVVVTGNHPREVTE